MTVYYSPTKFFIWLISIFFILLIFNIIGAICYFNLDNRFVTHLYNASSFNSETSLSTLYSSIILLFASLLLFFIYVCSKRKMNVNASWLLLSIIFLYISIDESISIHERFIMVFREKFNLLGLLYYSWVIPFGILLIVLLIYLIPFLLKLEKKTRNLFIISGIIFVSGAMGIELFEGRHHELYGEKNAGYVIFYTIEESFEMLGVSIFIYSLLRYISIIEQKNIQIAFSN